MRAFNIETDLETINGWLIARNLDPLEKRDIPEYGMIVPNVACGFLVNTDTTTCFLEAFISNKEARIEERSKALNKIAKWGIGMAATVGYKRVIALTGKKSLLALCEDLGFEFKDLKLAYKDL
jgi:hypothetical protein